MPTLYLTFNKKKKIYKNKIKNNAASKCDMNFFHFSLHTSSPNLIPNQTSRFHREKKGETIIKKKKKFYV